MGVIPIFALCPAELWNFTARLVTLQSEAASVRLHLLFLLQACVRVTHMYSHLNTLHAYTLHIDIDVKDSSIRYVC